MDKRRSAHEMARGKKNPSLTDLSRDLPNEEEVANYLTLLAAETDRGAAIMAGAFVENALWLAINCTISDPGEKLRKRWFDGTGPFATFAAKVALGRAIGIYGDGMGGRLSVIKDIRNQFAHASRPITFSSPAVVSACKSLIPEGEKYNALPARKAYVTACMALAKVLAAYSFKKGGQTIAPHFP